MLATSRAKPISWVAISMVMPSRASSPTSVSTSDDQLRVERARDLVEEHHAGLHRERPDDGDALLLTAGEPVGILVALLPQPDPIEERVGAVDRLGCSRAPRTFAARA